MSKIAIIHPWDRSKWNEPVIWDGLHGALKIVGEKHQVDWFLQGDEPDDSYDWIIPWGVMSIPFNNTIEKYRGKKAIFCAGHPQDKANMDKFDAIFVESPEMLEAFKPYHPRVVLAFGTDTDFFRPTGEEKMFDAFYPATYSPWKRQDLFAEATKGYKALTAGYIQPDGFNLYRQCDEIGGYVMGGLVPTNIIAKLYNMSKVVVITGYHGSERTALEAMASGAPVVITRDNTLTLSLLPAGAIIVNPDPVSIRKGFEEALELLEEGMDLSLRQYVLDNYSHKLYAQKILGVIEG